MEKITIWERIKKVKEDDLEKEVIVHNHIEPDWIEGDKPQPIDSKFEQQKVWSTYKWKKTFAYLDDNKVIL